MLNALKLVCLLIVLSFVSPAVHADLNGAGGDISGMGDDGNADADKQAGCTIAGAGRLMLDTAAHNCNPGKSSVNGGQLPNDAGICASPPGDGTSIPPIEYLLGGKTNLGSGDIPVPKQIDCSGMISTVMCRAGMDFMPGKSCEALNTGDMIDQIKGGHSCFKAIPGGGGLQPGDMVVYKHSGELGAKGIGHVFIINSVDKERKCFSINQAAGGQAKVGIENFCGQSPNMGGDQGMALKAATEVMNGKASSISDEIEVVRFDSSNRSCKGPNKKFEGESSCDVGRVQ